jgi:glyoxylase-like metal-dependent hydrolase (beta-lactamase superfamily II)
MDRIMDNIVTLTINSTHFYLVDCKGGRLLVDAGWGMPQLTQRLKAYQISFSEIKYVMFTHHHPDHAGLVQNIKDISGAKLIIHEKQIPFLKDLQRYFEKKGGYEPIRVEKEDLITPDRAVLHSIGIQGEIIETPGHSDDSVSLVLDRGVAFIGDLHPPEYTVEENYKQTCESWNKLISRNVQWFYPSHSNPFPASQIRGDCLDFS